MILKTNGIGQFFEMWDAKPEDVGAFPVRQDITVLPADNHPYDPDGRHVVRYTEEEKIKFFDDLCKASLEMKSKRTWADQEDEEERELRGSMILNRLWDIARGHPYGLFRIYERVGTVVVNDYAVSKIEVKKSDTEDTKG